MQTGIREQLLQYRIFNSKKQVNFIVNRFYTGTRKLPEILIKLTKNEINEENFQRYI